VCPAQKATTQAYSPGALAPHRSPSQTIDVTYADNGDSYRLHIGDDLDVTLSNSSTSSWSEPSSSNSAVLQLQSGSSGATATGVFLAVGRGRTEVSAIGTPSCAPVCLVLEAFEVNVTVIRTR